MTLDLKARREQPHAMTCEATFSECAEANCNCGKDERDALIDELTEARRADWATGLCSAHQQPDPLCHICNPALAHARAAAFEEAALACEAHRQNGNIDDDLASEVRALSATPATVVCVPVEERSRRERTAREAEIAKLRAQLVLMDEQLTRGPDQGRLRAYEDALKTIAANTNSNIAAWARSIARGVLAPPEAQYRLHGEQCRAWDDSGRRCLLLTKHNGAHFNGTFSWAMKRRGQPADTMPNPAAHAAALASWEVE